MTNVEKAKQMLQEDFDGIKNSHQIALKAVELAAKKDGYTENEKEISDKISEIQSLFLLLEQTYPFELKQFLTVSNELEKILAFRILRRDYPELFS